MILRQMNSLKLLKPIKLLDVNLSTTLSSLHHAAPPQSSQSFSITVEHSKLFFDKENQSLMKSLTGMELEKIYQKRIIGDNVTPPRYEFMTDEQLKQAQTDAVRRAYMKLQMPPIVPVASDKVEILDNVPEMLGYARSKFVFTDISFDVSDKNRFIVVREPDGILRKATPSERHRMNSLYFPRTGRSYMHPKLFEPENLEKLCEEQKYEHILDRACCHYEPDYPDFHRVLFYTFDKVNEKKCFNLLRSTRHFGPMVFYLCITRKLTNLIEEMLETGRLSNIVTLIKLYVKINPDCKFIHENSQDASDNTIEFVKAFISSETSSPDKLSQLVDTYTTETR